MDRLDKEFEEQMAEASVSMRDEHKTEEFTHIQNKNDLDTYLRDVEKEGGRNKAPGAPLWCLEFNQCIGEVLEEGAKKYAPRDWEKPDGYSMGYKAQCGAIFHHLAREFVYKENQELIDGLMVEGFPLCAQSGEALQRLLKALKYDEMGTRHTQHVATRSVMSFTREKRGLD